MASPSLSAGPRRCSCACRRTRLSLILPDDDQCHRGLPANIILIFPRRDGSCMPRRARRVLSQERDDVPPPPRSASDARASLPPRLPTSRPPYRGASRSSRSSSCGVGHQLLCSGCAATPAGAAFSPRARPPLRGGVSPPSPHRARVTGRGHLPATAARPLDPKLLSIGTACSSFDRVVTLAPWPPVRPAARSPGRARRRKFGGLLRGAAHMLAAPADDGLRTRSRPSRPPRPRRENALPKPMLAA